MDKDIKRLLETADRYGLMPSFLFCPASDRAKKMGLVEDCVVNGMKWQRLTEKGQSKRAELLYKP